MHHHLERDYQVVTPVDRHHTEQEITWRGTVSSLSGYAPMARGSRERAVLVHCRAGFEREAAEELAGQAAARGISGTTEARPGLALFMPAPPVALAAIAAAPRYADLVFARQLLFSSALCTGLAVGDRVAPLVAAARAQANRSVPGPSDLAPAISFSWVREHLAFSPNSRRKATLERQAFSVAWVS